MDNWATALAEVFKARRVSKAVCFFEFYGPGSFAGNHEENDEHKVTLIDAAINNKGIIEPKEFIKWFEGMPHAPLLYKGAFTNELEEQVKSGTLPGMTFEGIICKGGCVSPGRPLMFKVKNLEWFKRLREVCAGNEELFNQLR